MKILAIDTSERQFSVAALNQNYLLEQIVFDPQTPAKFEQNLTGKSGVATSSSGVAVELFPMIRRLLSQVSWKIADIELLAVAKGPGSFTGLRTGVVAAKTMAYANNIPVQGANTLEAMAAQLAWFLAAQATENQCDAVPDRKIVHCVVNAQRQQLFAGRYEILVDPAQGFQLTQSSAPSVVSREQWLEGIGPFEWVTGSGLKPVLDSLKRRDTKIAPSELWNSQAGSVGKLAWRDFSLGSRDSIWTLEPIYFRPSYADENG